MLSLIITEKHVSKPGLHDCPTVEIKKNNRRLRML